MCDRQGSVRMNLFEPQYAELNSLGIRSVTSVTGRPVSPCQSVEVPADALDQFCDAKQIERINFLKVDVEGFELSVFRAQNSCSESTVWIISVSRFLRKRSGLHPSKPVQ